MITIEDLASRLTSARTVLFLGAGASVPSGCPSGSNLALRLEAVLDHNHHHSDDLAEVCSILEVKYGRKALVDAVANVLRDVPPSGGLLALPELEWTAIYTTNYDRLVEEAFRRCHKPCVPIRSQYDYGRLESDGGTPLFKIHGCITQDRALGNLASMILTEDDYDSLDKHRQLLFNRLTLDSLNRDLLIVGSSLRDPHLRRQIREIGHLKTEAGTGRIYVLLHDRDADRAQLLERMRGVHEVAFGGIDEILQHLIQTASSTMPEPAVTSAGQPFLLPVPLRACTVDVATAGTAVEPNARKLFQGAPATYADVEAGLTFSRAVESVVLTALRQGKVAATLLGGGGVGKTTAIRRMASALSREGLYVWEHNADFPFRADDWSEVLPALEGLSARAVIVVDDCPRFQRDVNHLIDDIVRRGSSNISVLLAGHTSEWNNRIISRWIFGKGIVERLRILEAPDIDSLLDLVETQSSISVLTDEKFRRLARPQRETTIRMRSSADMFVALKYIFASDSLDDILLREYAALPEDMARIYGYVAAIHSTGTGASRQLIIRGLSVLADDVSRILELLEDVVEEREVSSSEGVYEWTTRHEVVARTLVKYKYFSDEEWFDVLEFLITQCNPTVYFEQRMLRYLCNSQFGVRRLASGHQRISLYEKILEVLPTERVAWHRLVYEYLTEGDTRSAESVIASAIENVGVDPPIQRYKVRLLIKRSQSPELTDADRRTLLRMARQEALTGTSQFSDNRYSFSVLENVAAAWQAFTGSKEMFEEFTPLVRDASERLLDPALDSTLRRMESALPAGSQDDFEPVDID